MRRCYRSRGVKAQIFKHKLVTHQPSLLSGEGGLAFPLLRGTENQPGA